MMMAVTNTAFLLEQFLQTVMRTSLQTVSSRETIHRVVVTHGCTQHISAQWKQQQCLKPISDALFLL